LTGRQPFDGWRPIDEGANAMLTESELATIDARCPGASHYLRQLDGGTGSAALTIELRRALQRGVVPRLWCDLYTHCVWNLPEAAGELAHYIRWENDNSDGGDDD
jgi:hypothetical protein